MFSTLRNRFLIVNLVTISIIMLAAFTTIYTITYRDVQKEMNMDLHRIMDRYQKSSRGDAGPPDYRKKDSELPSTENKPVDYGESAQERSVSFMLMTDRESNLIGRDSMFTMDDDFYHSALQKARNTGKDTGKFTLDGSKWIFHVQPTSAGAMYVYLDITSQQTILTNLIYTFTIVGSVMLILLYFVSRYFANRSIIPIKDAFDKQKQFIADASHELKTPLTIINTNADVLLSLNETTHHQSKWLHYIKSEAERMTRLTNDLLYLTEMDDSRTSMIFSKFNLSEAVETIILTMEAVVFEKDVALDYDIEPDLFVKGNREQIKQVVMILLDNAVKYTNARGSVTLSLKKQRNDAVLSVTNTGEGIAAQHLTRIFDRFYRTDASRGRKQGGYGLGLAIAKSIISQHKGSIYAKSVVGESTTFYVHLS